MFKLDEEVQEIIDEMDKQASRMPYKVKTAGVDGKSLEFQYATLDDAKADAVKFMKNEPDGFAIITYTYEDENGNIHTDVVEENGVKSGAIEVPDGFICSAKGYKKLASFIKPEFLEMYKDFDDETIDDMIRQEKKLARKCC